MAIGVDGTRVTLDGKDWSAELDGPRVRSIRSRSGMPIVGPSGGLGLVDAGGDTVWLRGAVTVERRCELVLAITVDAPEGVGELVVQADESTGDLVLTPRILSARGDVAGVSVHLAVEASLELHVPALAGMRFGTDHDLLPAFEFQWPRTWSAAMVIAHGDGAGAMVHAEDPDLRSKTLGLGRSAEASDLTFRTEEQAPFGGRRTAEGLAWRFSAYRGDWRDEPISRYQRWMLSRSGPAATPDWASEVRLFVSFAPTDMDFARELAGHVDPRATLIHLPEWRSDPYDRNYPVYEAADHIPGFVDDLHGLGYRVIPHTNVFAVDVHGGAYEQLREFHLADPFTGEPLAWHWPVPGQSPIDLAYIHPGSRRWREWFVRTLSGVLDRHPFDGVFIDQTFHGYNHAGGLVDGLNVAQGMDRILADVHEALGPMVVGGEGINEVIAPWQAFSQVAPIGFMWGKDWYLDADQVARACSPVNRLLFEPYTRCVTYWPIEGKAIGGRPMLDCYERVGVLPSLVHPTREMLLDPSPLTEPILAAARAGRALGDPARDSTMIRDGKDLP